MSSPNNQVLPLSWAADSARADQERSRLEASASTSTNAVMSYATVANVGAVDEIHTTILSTANYRNARSNDTVPIRYEHGGLPFGFKNVEINKERQLINQKAFSNYINNDPDGTYVVRLPFREDCPPDLGNNLNNAKTRLLKLERSLEYKPEFRMLYQENLKDYVDQGHMTLAKEPSTYVLIHHGVMKASSTTTKVRVVFSPAERASPHHRSLNDHLLVGPKLQSDINDLILNFRLNKVAITADIRQMYRAIKVDPRDSPFQQILWREDSSQPIQQYEIQRVCFGVASAPFQA